MNALLFEHYLNNSNVGIKDHLVQVKPDVLVRFKSYLSLMTRTFWYLLSSATSRDRR